MRATVTAAGPFDLAASFAAASRFLPLVAQGGTRLALPIDGGASCATLRQVSLRPARIEVSSTALVSRALLRREVAWQLSAELDLRPFYRLVAAHPVLGPMTRRLRGVKPLRPASLFEMAVVAITEQQISLAAAYHIRQCLIDRFGARRGLHRAFPAPRALAHASLRALRSCGLSHRKAEYISALAQQVAQGEVNLDRLRSMSDIAAHDYIRTLRGFGLWSADYILVRGLGRADCVPTDDLGIRDAVGTYLGAGRRVSAKAVARLLEPFAPYRGLAVFYLLIERRRERVASPRIEGRGGRSIRSPAIRALRPRSSAG
jgi:DNA-3-methyladenine glycosylase II